MNITHDKTAGRFNLVNDDGKTIGEIDYVPESKGVIRATHTGVRPEFEGQGLAGKLLASLVEYAEAEHLKIIPQCSYVARAFERHPDRYAKVIPGVPP